ncbi:ComG operon protein 1 [Ligilactobacillus agilis DSM 20509]|uniref:ComG operon protein 1 n=1 Tax=Ligilactobacillus agilis DSM 20509 TaxID=1423718 RepID=A0A0R2AFS3_9LACO|nr:competence type IV pilus ATPase ComGA [Ligilactobacillus agilis]KRM65557.1 ComG operon protein 1 [Ligilactobacillus agilis DSM 20509]
MQSELRTILAKAIKQRASDIYFLPKDDYFSVGFSLAGKYYFQSKLPLVVGQQCLNYLKFKADMSLSEQRRPQLGAWVYKWQGEVIFCRLSTVGDFLNRESLVIRLIYDGVKQQQGYFFSDQWELVRTACQKRGMIIFAGPMGSGKTSAMYYFARQLQDKQVLCIEDPIEIYEPDFLQLQVNDKALMGYADLLKVALRHHPDVFIIGEVRDEGTAQAVVRAALSGHLILTTVHAQSALGVVERLENLGLSRADLNQTVQLISYQRLIPTCDGSVKVLFDQVDNQTLLTAKPTQRMSTEWGQRLEKCYQNKWISLEIQKKYQAG